MRRGQDEREQDGMTTQLLCRSLGNVLRRGRGGRSEVTAAFPSFLLRCIEMVSKSDPAPPQPQSSSSDFSRPSPIQSHWPHHSTLRLSSSGIRSCPPRPKPIPKWQKSTRSCHPYRLPRTNAAQSTQPHVAQSSQLNKTLVITRVPIDAIMDHRSGLLRAVHNYTMNSADGRAQAGTTRNNKRQAWNLDPAADHQCALGRACFASADRSVTGQTRLASHAGSALTHHITA